MAAGPWGARRGVDVGAGEAKPHSAAVHGHRAQGVATWPSAAVGELACSGLFVGGEV